MLLASVLAVLPLLAPQEPGAFRPLFDGRTLAGWSGDERYWSVQDGVLVGESTEATPLHRSTYLVHEALDVADLELELEFRIPSGNSGVQFRSQRVGHHVLAGYQADLEAESTRTGSLYEQFGRGVLAGRGERARHPPAGTPERERFADAEALGRTILPGQWNRMRILAEGDRVRIEVNGTTTCDAVDRHAQWARSHGAIGLQLHEGPPMRVEFRNLRLRDLGGARSRTPWIPPQWIWTDPEPGEAGREAWFAQTFELASAPATARLLGSADDRMEVYLNGHLVAISESFAYRFELDVTPWLRAGPNALTTWTRNERADAGLWLELRVRAAGGLERHFTDGSWRHRAEEPRDLARPFASSPEGWSPVTSLGPVGSSPWGMPRPSPRGAPQEALEATELERPEGFEVELVYSVPQARLGSWVSLAMDPADPAGRLVASDQIGYLHRVTPGGRDAAGNALPPRCERLDVDLGAAQGLTFAFGSLYVVVNDLTERWTSGLYRLRDEDADGRYERVELLHAFEGFGEHGAHAVVPGPLGRWLYVVSGGVTPPPEEPRHLARVRVAPDDLLPAAPDPNGHPPGATASGGWIARTDADGTCWELVAVGLRNPYDLAFARNGELFTVDSDMEWDRGLPWYRAPRLLQIVEGADYGWRYGSAKWRDDFPDTLPSVLPLGPGSPTGMLHGAELAFPERYRDALFVGDWSFGRIQAMHLEPAGAGHRASVETFLRGSPLPVCDLAAGPDGALYFVTGGRGLKSAVYRVRWNGERATSPAKTPLPPEAQVRRRLEAIARIAPHGDELAAARLEVVRPWLDDEDAFLRHAARKALESLPLASWRAEALEETRPRARVQGWLALVEAGGTDDRVTTELRAELVERLAALPWDTLETRERRDLLRVVDRLLVRLAPLTRDQEDRLRRTLEPLFPPTPDARHDQASDRALAELLIHLRSPVAPERCLARIESAADPSAAIAYGFPLRHARAGWDAARRERYFRWWHAVLESATGGESLRNYLVDARRTALDALGAEERTALGALAGPPPALRRDPVPGRPFVRTWTRAELEPHLGRLGEPRDLERGARLFEEATCLECHRIGDAGGSDGPDLTQARARFQPRDLLTTILEPSRAVSDQYRDTEVWTRSGTLHVGVVLHEDAESLTLRTRPPESERHRIAKEEIEERRPTELSRMPEGLLDTLALEEVLDLFAYVLEDRR